MKTKEPILEKVVLNTGGDIIYLMDKNNKAFGKIDLTMGKICGKVFEGFKIQKDFN
jgi:hypothetical protein